MLVLASVGGADNLDVQSIDLTIVCGKADLNCDGSVDFKDYAKLANDWLKTGQYLPGDIDKDEFIDCNDLKGLTLNWLWPRDEIGQPDLYIHSFVIHSFDITFSNPYPASGEQITVGVTVHNIGDADATEFDVYISVSYSWDGVNWTLPMPWAGFNIPYIFASSFSTAYINTSFSPPFTRLCVIVDCYNQVQESNETNNIASEVLMTL